MFNIIKGCYIQFSLCLVIRRLWNGQMYYTANHTGAASCMQQDYTHYYAEKQKTTIIYHYHGVFLSWYNKEKKKRKSQSQGFGRPKKWPFYCVYFFYIRRHLKKYTALPASIVAVTSCFLFQRGSLVLGADQKWCHQGLLNKPDPPPSPRSPFVTFWLTPPSPPITTLCSDI